MRYRNLFGLGTICVLALALSSQAAVVNLGLRLQDTDGNDLPNNVLNPGDIFQVVLSVSVSTPNMTDTARNNAVQNNVPLGVAALGVDLVTPGTVNKIVPRDAGGNTWEGYGGAGIVSDQGYQLPFTNLNDVDFDGDLDVFGLGFGNPNTSLARNASVTTVDRFQIGADPGNPPPTDVLLGWYEAVDGGPVVLRTVTQYVNIYFDPPTTSGDTVPNREALQAPQGNVSNAIIEATIDDIVVSPEPGSLGMLGLALVGMLGARRRTA